MTPFYDFCCFRCVSHCYNSDNADGFGDLDFLQYGDISAIGTHFLVPFCTLSPETRLFSAASLLDLLS